MTHMIFAKMNNAPGRQDATGAFLPESRALYKMMVDRNYDVRYRTIGTDVFDDRVQMTENTMRLIRKHERIKSLSFFCHGWRSGVQLLPRGKQGAAALAAEMALRGVKLLNLFCCSTAEPHPKGNFAQWVHFACEELGHRAQIMGHETAGHTTANPMVRFYWPGGERSLSTAPSGFKKEMKDNQEYRLWLPFDFQHS